MNSIKVSVITVCLNSSKYLEDAIRSVKEQTYKNIEYIIIDGGSTDGTQEILRRYSNRISKLIVEKDKGVFDAMNKGISLASGEVLYFLNSDDKLYSNNVIENVVNFLIENKEADFIYGDMEVINPADNFSYIERYPDKISKWLFITKTIAQPGSFFKADCFKKCGYFDINYKFAADHDWYLKAIFIKKLKAVHIEDCISVFRLGGLSNDRKYARDYFLERKVIEKKYLNSFELLCADFMHAIKMFLGRKTMSFLHRTRVGVFNRK